ncbi:response regulator [Dyadobacter sp. CY356]|uniref:response regulator n=1 Tax=Dyadobacter sp. CY356 TaxID=2906442 RepID=UPI001F4023FE|nr:response regulator [Dyadobacter sp. CY356]MCF0057068.1 response regulator [Dyadobacter sp. CY356]
MTDKKELYIVDDSADHRFLLENIFSKFLPQYPVRFFEGAQEFYHFLIQQSAPDYKGKEPGLIILDLKMPFINGYELLKLLRQTPDNEKTQWKSLPVVMMSSEEAPFQINQCYQAGANSFLTKPLLVEELRDLLKTTCQYWLDFNRSPSLKQLI